MKKVLLTICLFTIAFIGFSQNKKEQIELLNLRLDSCKTVMSNQSSDIKSKQIQIADLEQQLKTEELKAQEKSKQITSLDKEIAEMKKVNDNQIKKFDSLIKALDRFRPDYNTLDFSSSFSVPSFTIPVFNDPNKKIKTGLTVSYSDVFELGEIRNGLVEIKDGVVYFDGYIEKKITGWVDTSSLYEYYQNPPVFWAFVTGNCEYVPIYNSPNETIKPYRIGKVGLASAGVIKNGFMEIDFYDEPYIGQTGWVRLTDLSQQSIPKTDDFFEEE